MRGPCQQARVRTEIELNQIVALAAVQVLLCLLGPDEQPLVEEVKEVQLCRLWEHGHMLKEVPTFDFLLLLRLVALLGVETIPCRRPCLEAGSQAPCSST